MPIERKVWMGIDGAVPVRRVAGTSKPIRSSFLLVPCKAEMVDMRFEGTSGLARPVLPARKAAYEAALSMKA